MDHLSDRYVNKTWFPDQEKLKIYYIYMRGGNCVFNFRTSCYFDGSAYELYHTDALSRLEELEPIFIQNSRSVETIINEYFSRNKKYFVQIEPDEELYEKLMAEYIDEERRIQASWKSALFDENKIRPGDLIGEIIYEEVCKEYTDRVYDRPRIGEHFGKYLLFVNRILTEIADSPFLPSILQGYASQKKI